MHPTLSAPRPVIHEAEQSSDPYCEESWNRLIDQAIAETDPVLANFRITRAHYLLGRALEKVTGPEAGANFHSWAVWGSRKAGVTIRQEDLDDALRDGGVAGGVSGVVMGLALSTLCAVYWGWWVVPLITVLGLLSGRWMGRKLILRSRREAARLVLHGNRIVLEDIGRITARFIATFQHQHRPNPVLLAQFLATLRPGESERGGQGLLIQAFTQYYNARFARTPAERHEATYFANCLAVLHEHHRLQPYILRSMPWLVRRCVTKRLMTFDVGERKLAVSRPVPAIDGMLFPSTLAHLHEPRLNEFLYGSQGWDPGREAFARTAARDWTNLRQRMGYIVNLFRALHTVEAVRSSPYTPEQMAEIGAGRLPAAPW